MERTEKRTRELLGKYQAGAKKNFSQNFLIDDNVINKICSSIVSFNPKEVIEIGCGLGSITFPLLEQSHLQETPFNINGFEIDNEMLEVLRGEIKDPLFTLNEQDFLKVELKEWEDKDPLIVGNLPYSITKRLIKKILNNDHPFSFAIMVQKEVADKLFYKTGNKENNPLGAYLAMHGTLEKLCIVEPSAFVPAPKVYSEFIIYKAKDSKIEDLVKLDKLYQNKNKMIKGNFKGLPVIVSKAFEDILENPNARIHELSIEQIKKILELPIF